MHGLILSAPPSDDGRQPALLALAAGEPCMTLNALYAVHCIWRGCRAAWGPRSMTHLEVGEVRGIDDGLPLVRREVRRHTDDLREPMDSGALWHCG